MLKNFAHMAFGALLFAGISAAVAAVGIAPQPGFNLIDGAWLNGLAGGLNGTYQYGITAAGTTQATATQVPSAISLVEIDTAASSTGIDLPPCLKGTSLSVYNNGAQTLTIYPAVANNPVTAAQDTINNGTSLSGGLATHTPEFFFCAKDGVWAAK